MSYARKYSHVSDSCCCTPPHQFSSVSNLISNSDGLVSIVSLQNPAKPSKTSCQMARLDKAETRWQLMRKALPISSWNNNVLIRYLPSKYLSRHTVNHAPPLCQPAHTTFLTDVSQPGQSSFCLRWSDFRCQTCSYTSLIQSTSMNSDSVSAYSFRNIQECNIQNSSISSISKKINHKKITSPKPPAPQKSPP